MNVESLVGRRFGRLLVTGRADNTKDGSARWYCKCDCGNPALVLAKGTALRAGQKKSCGCMTKLIDLTGMTFGRLTVVRRAENKGNTTRWYCQCSCGNPELVIANASNLRRGITKSCGCIAKEKRKMREGPQNQYEFHDGYVAGFTSSGSTFLVDVEDYEKIKDICWYDTSQGYVGGNNREGKIVILHRLIMNNPDAIVDHINHNTMDNRKCNLRCVDQSQNAMNSKLRPTNKSGVTGVSWFERDKKWRASITINRKSINLGCYDTIEEAASVRKAAEEKYFGQYSYSNSMRTATRVLVA